MIEERIEFWRPVVGFEGLYEVSTDGRVNSIARQLKGIGKCDTCSRTIKGGIMSPSYYPDGYLKVTLSKDRIIYYCRVHRLVAHAFLFNPDNKKEVNHINGIKDDNRLENLEWVTASENTLHLYRTKLKLPRKGNRNKHSKCIQQLDMDNNLIQLWGSMGEAARAGFELSSISGCCRGKYKFHRGFKWKYCNQEAA